MRWSKTVVLWGAMLATACGAPPTETEDAMPAENGEHAEAGHEAGILRLDAEKLAEMDLETTVVELRSLPAQLETTGEVGFDEDHMAHVSPRIEGRIHRAPARLGDRVATGDVLAVLDSIELGRAQAEWLAARATEEVTRQAFEREQRLYADRITSEREMLEARAEWIQARARLDGATQALRLYGLAEGEIEELAQADGAERSLLPVRAPFAGRLVEKHATLGELVSPRDNLFTLADLSRVWIWIDVYERDLAAVHLEDDVEVTVPSYPDRTFQGEVTYLAPQVAEDTRTVRARIDVPNPERLLRPGMFARVRLIDPHAETAPVPVVPADAVVRQDNEEIVFVALDDGRFARRVVETGRRAESRVEILSGVAPGDRVVTRGAFLLKSELSREALGGGHTH